MPSEDDNTKPTDAMPRARARAEYVREVPDVEEVPELPTVMRWLRRLLRIKERRFPFKTPPLRVPGQGLESDLSDAIGQIAISITLCGMAGVGLIGYNLYKVPARLWHLDGFLFFVNVLANFAIILTPIVIALVFGLMWLKKELIKMENISIGLTAERYVGQQLERCRYLGYSVFHDIVIDAEKKFNIDHAAIGPGGIFVLETKARCKPEEPQAGPPTIVFDGSAVTFPGGFRTIDPVRQVWANADWLRDKLKELLAQERDTVCKFTVEEPMPMRPLLVYPGWFIDYSKASGTSLRVITDAVLLDQLRNSPQRLSKEEVKELAELFGEYLRRQRRNLVK